MQFNSVNDFLVHVQEELDNNRLTLPTLPDIAIKVRATINKENVSAQELADIIVTDAVLSARIIHVANSPLYKGNAEIKNIQLAVSRLGSDTIRSLVTSFVMQQMYTPSSKILESHFKKIWEESINISSISRALARFAPELNPDEAMLAGLLHQIGKLPILVLVEDIPEFRDSPTRLAKLLEKAHPLIGKIIMDSWSFPDELKLVASQYTNFTNTLDGPATYVDVVQVAFLQSIVGTDHPACRVDCSTVNAFNKLGLSSHSEILEIEGISDEIELAKESLF